MNIFAIFTVIFVFSLPGMQAQFDDYFNPGDAAEWDPERKNGTLSYTISGYISRAPATGAMWTVFLAPVLNMFFAPDNFKTEQ
jgi:hypothetical protein